METNQMLKLLEQDQCSLESELEASPELLKKRDINQRILLHWAALQGRVQLVEYLLKTSDSEVDATDDSNATPLILAVLKGNAQIVEWLVEKGANINHQNAQGHSPLQYACSKGWSDVVAFLLARGADVNIRDNRGDTALHRLASLGRLELLKIILAHNPKPCLDVQNAEGNTAMHLACEDNEVSSALLLLDHGASVDIENKLKQSPFDLAKPGLRRTINEKKTAKSQ